jgi:hypothetical protein
VQWPEAIFGVPLEILIEKQKKTAQLKGSEELAKENIPSFVKKATEILHVKGLEEGIFRISASAEDVNKLKQHIDKGGDLDVLDNVDCHTIACLLKLFLRELPNCLLTGNMYDQWLDAVGKFVCTIE